MKQLIRDSLNVSNKKIVIILLSVEQLCFTELCIKISTIPVNKSSYSGTLQMERSCSAWTCIFMKTEYLIFRF